MLIYRLPLVGAEQWDNIKQVSIEWNDMKEMSWKASDCLTMPFHNTLFTSNDFNN